MRGRKTTTKHGDGEADQRKCSISEGQGDITRTPTERLTSMGSRHSLPPSLEEQEAKIERPVFKRKAEGVNSRWPPCSL